jgi:hypothetical protein
MRPGFNTFAPGKVGKGMVVYVNLDCVGAVANDFFGIFFGLRQEFFEPIARVVLLGAKNICKYS